MSDISHILFLEVCFSPMGSYKSVDHHNLPLVAREYRWLSTVNALAFILVFD